MVTPVANTPPVIDPIARYSLRIAIFAYGTILEFNTPVRGVPVGI